MGILEAETVLGTLISKRLLIQMPHCGAESYVLARGQIPTSVAPTCDHLSRSRFPSGICADT